MKPASPAPPATRIGELLRAAAARLERAGVDGPRLTAELLLAEALGRQRVDLITYPESEVGPEQRERFQELVERRQGGEPTQYLLGRQEFYGREFLVNPAVLIPRPETELLLERALELARPDDRVADVGCGSGCIAVSLALEKRGLAPAASDVSAAALAVARRNAQQLGADVHFLHADITSAFRAASLDLVVSNPPYVPLRDAPGLQRELRAEPSLALFGGEDGLTFYRRLAREGARVIRPGGWLLLELGYNTRAAVESLLDGPLWTERSVRPDFAGIDRVVEVRRSTAAAQRP